ncbi:defective proboscis extension response 1 [Haematobia irritans]|uniref:defective proboscis extension response 1 n=1 Tax=Haematobia irritans TaxID=7368 RepID=UPI003F500CA0
MEFQEYNEENQQEQGHADDHYNHQPEIPDCQSSHLPPASSFTSTYHHHKTRRHYFPRCGLILLIFLTVIKESLTTYSTYPALDITTVSPTNLLPYFDFDVPRNVTVTVGQTGFLHCRVERLGDKDVSWIRKRDLHILTAGSTTYTSDQRFQVLRPENSVNWTLQIKYPQPRDSGIYECQINTEPKMSLSYTFNVVELKANIIGPTDLYVKSGSDINLTCKIMQGPHELGNIFWYKGLEIIDMSTNQNEIDSGTRITMENDWSDGLTSRLKIRRAMPSDTGNYTCVPTIAKSSSVYVHVIIGEHPAAMQHNSSRMRSSNFYFSICCMLFALLTCCLQHLMCTTDVARAGETTTMARNLMLAPLTGVKTTTFMGKQSQQQQQQQHKKHITAVAKRLQSKPKGLSPSTTGVGPNCSTISSLDAGLHAVKTNADIKNATTTFSNNLPVVSCHSRDLR